MARDQYDQSGFSVWGFIKGFGKLIIGFLLLLQGLVGLILLLVIVGLFGNASGMLSGNNDRVTANLRDGTAFVLNPVGVLVEQAPMPDPFGELIESAYGVQEPSPVDMQDLVRAIRTAKTDKRIKAMVMNLDGLAIAGNSKVYALIDEIEGFKESGKKVYAFSSFYGQSQYLVASHADEIVLTDGGAVSLYGYGVYPTYYKSLFEKLKVTSHIFRVGTFKAAVEPRLRDDMSEEAKEANRVLIDSFWDRYTTEVSQVRGISKDAVHRYADAYNEVMRENGGNASQAALQTGLVDKVERASDIRKFLVKTFGKGANNKGFLGVSYKDYLSTLAMPANGTAKDIAIITAAGTIIPGDSRPGSLAGSTTIVDYLYKAKDDANVGAVVLRVDSPGGSAFASELIHDAIQDVQAAGKPVITSMGSLAASGGYLIAAPTNEIWASPTTITGSIGIFAAFDTYENLAAEVGVFVDGVGTTSQSSLLSTGIGALPPVTAEALQLGVEHGYERFLKIVAEGRELERDYVDSVGQGRIWTGAKAKELKLVDKLGSLDDAIKSAASWANLTDWDVVRYEDRRNAFEKLFGGASASMIKMTGLHKTIARHQTSALGKVVAAVDDHAAFLDSFQDPSSLYMRCLSCEAMATAQ